MQDERDDQLTIRGYDLNGELRIIQTTDRSTAKSVAQLWKDSGFRRVSIKQDRLKNG